MSKFLDMYMSLKVTSKFNIPGMIPTWNASSWSSRWDQPIWMICLDWRGVSWPGTANLYTKSIQVKRRCWKCWTYIMDRKKGSSKSDKDTVQINLVLIVLMQWSQTHKASYFFCIAVQCTAQCSVWEGFVSLQELEQCASSYQRSYCLPI